MNTELERRRNKDYAFKRSFNTTLNYIYDKKSGMLLESTTQTTTQNDPSPVTTTTTYSVIDTNIFEAKPSPSPSIPELPTPSVAIIILLVTVSAGVFLVKNRRPRKIK
jgi:hypothetical protein